MIDNADKISLMKSTYFTNTHHASKIKEYGWEWTWIFSLWVELQQLEKKWIKYTVINRFAQMLSINSCTQWRTFECCKLNCGVDEYNF